MNIPTLAVYVLYFNEDLNGRYVGITNNIRRRVAQHTAPSSLKHKSIKASWLKKNLKLGHKLQVEILDTFTNREELNQAEIEYIKLYKSLGYSIKNGTVGGDGCIGFTRTPEYLAKLSKAGKGRVFTAETRTKISKAHKGRMTDKEKLKLIERSQKTYRILDPNGSEIIVTNLKQFCRDNNLNYSNMFQVMYGNRKQHKGYKLKGVVL